LKATIFALIPVLKALSPAVHMMRNRDVELIAALGLRRILRPRRANFQAKQNRMVYAPATAMA
jgi:hypothetical protein